VDWVKFHNPKTIPECEAAWFSGPIAGDWDILGGLNWRGMTDWVLRVVPLGSLMLVGHRIRKIIQEIMEGIDDG
jgi:hypothetical protein